jgi:hypothetical protein
MKNYYIVLLSVLFLNSAIFAIDFTIFFPVKWIKALIGTKEYTPYDTEVYDRLSDFWKPFDPSLMQKEAEDEFKKAFGISDEIWDKTQKKLEEKRSFLTMPRTNYVHDASIPKEMLDRVYYLLKKYGIEPTSIDIIRKDEESHLNGNVTYASVQQHAYQYNVSILNLNCKVLEPLLSDFFDAIIVHEIGHLINGHNFFFSILFDYLLHNGKHAHTRKELEEIQNSNFFKENNLLKKRLEFLKVESQKTAEMKNNKAYCNLAKIHEYVADQYFAYVDEDVRIKMLCLRIISIFSPATNSYYPTGKESLVSFCNNLIRPRLHFLTRLFSEFNPA